jgi:hypothetical protein
MYVLYTQFQKVLICRGFVIPSRALCEQSRTGPPHNVVGAATDPATYAGNRPGGEVSQCQTRTGHSEAARAQRSQWGGEARRHTALSPSAP